MVNINDSFKPTPASAFNYALMPCCCSLI